MYVVYMDDNGSYQCAPESQFNDEMYAVIRRGSREFCLAYINSLYTQSMGDFETRNHRDIVNDNDNDQGADLSPWTKDDF